MWKRFHTTVTGMAPAGTPAPVAADAIRFPPGFVWGAATASFQIEGRQPGDGRGECIWDRFCATPGAIADGSNGLVACDHVNRWPTDIALLGELGLGAYRFSISWPRVQPLGRGPTNPAGLDFYDRLVDGLLAAGITPYPTLYHWDLPQVLEDEGGWRNRATAEAFGDYADLVTTRLADRIPTWMTLNEPFCSAWLGHATGEHAPGLRDPNAATIAAHHLLLAHGFAMERIRANAPHAQAGIVLNFTPVRPRSDAPDDVAAAAVVDGRENRWYVEPIAGLGYPQDIAEALGWDGAEIRPGDLALIAAPLDVLGINYYTTQIVGADGVVPPTGPVTAMNWPITPTGLEDLLRGVHARHRFPRYLIMENGAAMPDHADADGHVDDADRIAYLHDHLARVAAVVDDGIPVAGYFAWSLLDNFEWAFGYSKRFGLVRVDFDTQRRIPKASAHWFGSVATTNQLPAQPSSPAQLPSAEREDRS